MSPKRITDAHGDPIFVEEANIFSASYGAVMQLRIPSESEDVADLRWAGNREQLREMIATLQALDTALGPELETTHSAV